MATLYDLELQESNNFIHTLLEHGQSPALKLMREQMTLSASMGEAGQMILKELEDPNSELGKSFARLNTLEQDVIQVMHDIGLPVELASQANTIFSSNPESLETLNEQERKIMSEYWLKKKSCIQQLLAKGYTYEELFS